MVMKFLAMPTAVFVVLSQPLLALAQQSDFRPHHWVWPDHWHLWNSAWGHWIFPIIALVLVTLCAAHFVVKAGGGPSTIDRQQDDPTASALQILNERFARGEIHKKEYEERKAALLTMTVPRL